MCAKGGQFASLRRRPVLTETVEKVENRRAPRISQMYRLSDSYRCKAL
jgi:hypothetical protein